MQYRNIDSVSQRINREKGKTVSHAFSSIKPSGGRGIKSRLLKPRLKKHHLQQLASAYLMLLMILQSMAGVFMYVPKEAKATGNTYYVNSNCVSS
jgi:hypothetical protein